MIMDNKSKNGSKRALFFAILIVSSLMAFSQTKVLLTVGSNSLTATLADNDATRELKSLLEKGPIAIQMSDYGGFEKVGSLPCSFPTSNRQITTVPGDIMLYQGNNMVIFYGSNSWSYTPLGKIDNASADNLKQFLGKGDITLTISLNSESGIENVSSKTEESIFDMKGNKITGKHPSPGVYIVNGKKTIRGER